MRLGVGAAVVGDDIVDGDIEIVDGRIEAVGLLPTRGSGLAVPGFVDVHVHGHAGHDFSTAPPSVYPGISKGLASTGVTAFQPTLMSMPVSRTVALLEDDSPVVPDGARSIGFHLEGPFLSPERAGAHDPTHLAKPDIDSIHRLVSTGKVAQVTLAPELDGAMEIIEALVEAGITVSLGHSTADAVTTADALSRGAAAFTHVFNAMGAFSHRAPGIVGAALSSDAYLTGVFDGVHLSPEAARVLIRCAGRRLVAITDGTALTGASGTASLGDRRVEIVDGVPRLADGTIAGSVLTMDLAFRNLVDLGCGLVEAVRAASTAPARLAGHDGGSLTPGSPADVVVLDDALMPEQVLVRGVEAHRV
jgi:N-acetylglucosamine-6-phosphate deacetylase